MVRDEQTHVLPEQKGERRRIAVLSGFADLAAFDSAVAALRRGVNARYGALFAEDEPLSSRRGNLVFTGVEDDPETLETLTKMGFAEPQQISSRIRSWHHGRIAATRTPRGRELFTRLAPRLLEAAAATGAADVAFNRFADFFGNLRSGVQIQSLFLAEPKLFSLVVEVMAFAPRLASTLARQPQALDRLLDEEAFAPKNGPALESEMAQTLEAGFEAAMDAVRRLHREEAFTIGVGVMSGAVDAEEAGAAFADLADACLRGLARASLLETERSAGVFPGAVAVLALGTAGAREMTATSDLDLMTVYQSDGPEAVSAVKAWSAETFYTRFTQRLVAALSAPTGEGTLYRVDLQLRPSGSAGPVAVSLAAFEGYYEAEAETWEHLALTRARVVWSSAPAIALACAQAVERALRRPRSRHAAAVDVLEMRQLMREARPPWGEWDLKLAPGGLVDIEFAAQFLQIVTGAAGGPLRANTGLALEALAAAAPALAADLEALAGAWRLQQRLSQVLKLALEEGANPALEPSPFRRVLARAGRKRSFPALQAALRRQKDAAAAAALRLITR
jgi:glutamate-ammonia-ligase adenylyltransferase